MSAQGEKVREVKRYLNDGDLLPDGRTYVLVSDYDHLAEQVRRMRSVLRMLDERLRECMKHPISAAEAYDSFYQDEVSAALSTDRENGNGA